MVREETTVFITSVVIIIVIISEYLMCMSYSVETKSESVVIDDIHNDGAVHVPQQV